MERVELVKRLSLLEEQKNLFLENIETAKTNGWLKDDYDDDYEDKGVEAEKLTAVNMVNADNTILEQQSLSTLDFRVHHLEKSILGFDPITKKASAHERFKEQLSLLKRVDEIKKEFNTIIRERDGADGLKSFLEIYDQVSECVSPFKDSALAMERVILTPEAKAEIISSSSEELKMVAENLKLIDELQPIIEAQEFKDLEKFLPQLTPIETVHIDQAAKANETSARTTCLLEKYNGIVNTLSELFISWDNILSTIEANVSAIERARGN